MIDVIGEHGVAEIDHGFWFVEHFRMFSGGLSRCLEAKGGAAMKTEKMRDANQQNEQNEQTPADFRKKRILMVPYIIEAQLFLAFFFGGGVSSPVWF